MVDLTQVIVALLTLVISVVSVFLIPFIRGRVSAERLEHIKFWVKVAVEAAEMIYTEGGKGAAKKAYVLDFLNSKGFTINTKELDNFIEAAVLELKLAERRKEEA